MNIPIDTKEYHMLQEGLSLLTMQRSASTEIAKGLMNDAKLDQFSEVIYRFERHRREVQALSTKLLKAFYRDAGEVEAKEGSCT